MHTLYHFRLCPLSRSIRLLLAELKIEVDLAEESPWLWRKDFLRINPSGELPLLLIEEGPALAGSYAISEYLSEELERNPLDRISAPIFPGGREARAEVRRLVDWFHRKFYFEISRELLEEKVYQRLRGGEASGPDVAVLQAARSNLRYHLGYISHLADRRNWLAGPELSFADLAAGAHLSSADYLGEVPWEEGSAAKLWYARLKSRPSFRALLAERVPGTPPPPAHYADPDF